MDTQNKNNITRGVVSHFICCLFIAGYITGIVLLSIEVNKHNRQVEESANNIYECYSPKNINKYGNLHKVCNSFELNNSKYFDLASNNKIDECEKACPSFSCVEDTRINIFNQINNVKFSRCFVNIDKKYFKFECKGMKKCDPEKYKEIGNMIYYTLYLALLVPIGGIILLLVCLFTYCFSDDCYVALVKKYITKEKASVKSTIESPPEKSNKNIESKPVEEITETNGITQNIVRNALLNNNSIGPINESSSSDSDDSSNDSHDDSSDSSSDSSSDDQKKVKSSKKEKSSEEIISADDDCICGETLLSNEITIKHCSFGGHHKIHTKCLTKWNVENPNRKCYMCIEIKKN